MLRNLTPSQPITARGVADAHGQIRLRTNGDGTLAANASRPVLLDPAPRKPLSPPAKR